MELPNGNVACLVCSLHHHIASPLTAREKFSKWLTQNEGLTKDNARKDRRRHLELEGGLYARCLAARDGRVQQQALRGIMARGDAANRTALKNLFLLVAFQVSSVRSELNARVRALDRCGFSCRGQLNNLTNQEARHGRLVGLQTRHGRLDASIFWRVPCHARFIRTLMRLDWFINRLLNHHHTAITITPPCTR